MSKEFATITLEEFKDYFRKNYSHISSEISDDEMQAWIDQGYVKGLSIERTADLFCDHLLACGIADVQE